MARATLNFTVTDEGRDKNKVFVVTEMSAFKAERWALRALKALVSSNAQIPDGFDRMGVAGLAQIGIRMLGELKIDLAESLLEEMMACVQVMPDPGKPHVIRPLIESDIEELQTLVKLRMEIWKIHTGFLKGVALPISTAAAAPTENSQNT